MQIEATSIDNNKNEYLLIKIKLQLINMITGM